MAAIAFDAVAQGFSAGATSITFSHVNAGNCVVVGVVGDTGSLGVTGATYAGIAMTAGGVLQGGTIGSTRDLYGFVLLDAPVGTANVVVSASSSVLLGAISASYFNVGSAPISGAFGGHGLIAVGFTPGVVTPVDGCWAAFLAKNDLDATIGFGASTTGRANNTNVGSGLSDNNSAVAVNTLITQNFSATGSTSFSEVCFILQPKSSSFLAVF